MPWIAVARTWFEPVAPVVTSTSARCSFASPSSHSSLRTLLPPYRREVRSSRFTQQEAPVIAESRESSCTAVGASTRETKGRLASPENRSASGFIVGHFRTPRGAQHLLGALEELALEPPGVLLVHELRAHEPRAVVARVAEHERRGVR